MGCVSIVAKGGALMDLDTHTMGWIIFIIIIIIMCVSKPASFDIDAWVISIILLEFVFAGRGHQTIVNSYDMWMCTRAANLCV